MKKTTTRFVVAYDKFKDCLPAGQLCSVTGQALQSSFPGAQVVLIPLADGGDGFLDCIEQSHASHPISGHNMQRIKMKATGPLGDPVDVFLRLDPGLVDELLAADSEHENGGKGTNEGVCGTGSSFGAADGSRG